MSYDKNGNILNLSRYGDIEGSLPANGIDNLVYTYASNTNKLLNVLDNSNNSSGFNDGNKIGDDYSYDGNGNLITDKNKNITAIVYNHLNLPTKITFGTTGTIEYIYNATGQKLEKIVTQSTTITSTNYLGGYQYTKPHLGTWVLQFFPTAEGYVKNTVVSGTNTYSYVFNYTDHLGNVRLSYSDVDKNGVIVSSEILDESHYYPFGLKHLGYVTALGTDNKYKYNGKELQDELGLGLYDLSARNYDPALGRFMNIDPLAEFQRKWSPYAFGFDNPIHNNDPTGLEGEEFAGKKKKKEDPVNGGTLKEVTVTAHKKKSSSTASVAASIAWGAVDFIPFAGSIKQIGVGIYEGNMTDVALGTVFLAVDIFTAGEGGTALRLAEVATEDALKIAAKDEAKELVEQNLDEIGEGIYEFQYLDEAGEVAEYTGQSKNVEKRLTQHTSGGKKVPIEGTVKKTSVKGGKTAREIHETKVYEFKKANSSIPQGNIRRPVSAAREVKLRQAGTWTD